jgi:hypothetical protein
MVMYFGVVDGAAVPVEEAYAIIQAKTTLCAAYLMGNNVLLNVPIHPIR